MVLIIFHLNFHIKDHQYLSLLSYYSTITSYVISGSLSPVSSSSLFALTQ